jgi:hypothetical protein
MTASRSTRPASTCSRSPRRRLAVRLAAYEVRIAASVEVIWTHLTTAEGLVHRVGPREGGGPPAGMGHFLSSLQDVLSAR